VQPAGPAPRKTQASSLAERNEALFPREVFHAEFREAVNLGARAGTKHYVAAGECRLILYPEGLWIGMLDKAGNQVETFVYQANIKGVSLTSANFDNYSNFAARAG
jgi:hypothetical protein